MCRDAEPSKHPIRVEGFGRYLLPDVPQLDDAIALEAEEMHERGAAVRRVVLHTRMHGHEVALLDGVQHVQPLLGILAGVLLHTRHQRIGSAVKMRVVMLEGSNS